MIATCVTTIRPIGRGTSAARLLSWHSRPALRWYDAYSVGPSSEGWRYQRDTPAYVQPYAVPRSRHAEWPGRQLTGEMLQEDLDAAMRYSRHVGL